MSNPYTSFISEVEAYCKARGIAEASLGSYAVNQSGLVDKLRRGGNSSLTTIERVRDYMAANPPQQKNAAQ